MGRRPLDVVLERFVVAFTRNVLKKDGGGGGVLALRFFPPKGHFTGVFIGGIPRTGPARRREDGKERGCTWWLVVAVRRIWRRKGHTVKRSRRVVEGGGEERRVGREGGREKRDGQTLGAKRGGEWDDDVDRFPT